MSKSEAITSRVVFFVGDDKEFFQEKAIEFTWYMGMSWQQRQRSSISLHESIRRLYPGIRVIEASTKSTDYELGRSLSAFNLTLEGIPIENVFQASKVFSDGGPYHDLLDVSPKEARSDERIKIDSKNKDRRLITFRYKQVDYPLKPRSMFYDYIYIKALSEHPELASRICEYDVFTDIEFNQKVPYSDRVGPFNCQARALAIFVSLERNGLTNEYLKDPGFPMNRIYGHASLPSQGMLDLG
ncbi:MAG: hypothetical protein FWE41_03915 [Coriobacteriia bacterium]|nr:hypothetical protein [Coriobacteriia bacterium]MCL2750622.1 hypothetical protein [Coriobacteriia bacterium]